MAGRDADASTRSQRDPVDLVGGAFVPTGDGVEPDREGVGVEPDHVALLLLAHDVADGPRPEHAVVEHHHRLARRQARVDEEPEAAQRALALQPRYEVVRQRYAFESGAEHELAGVEDERTSLTHLDQLGEVFLMLLGVDVGRGVVAEDAEVAVDVEVDRRRLHRLVAQRVDHDATGRELLPDGDVRQDHGGEPIQGVSCLRPCRTRNPCPTIRRRSRTTGTAPARPRGSAAAGSGATPCPGRSAWRGTARPRRTG